MTSPITCLNLDLMFVPVVLGLHMPFNAATPVEITMGQTELVLPMPLALALLNEHGMAC